MLAFRACVTGTGPSHDSESDHQTPRAGPGPETKASTRTWKGLRLSWSLFTVGLNLSIFRGGEWSASAQVTVRPW